MEVSNILVPIAESVEDAYKYAKENIKFDFTPARKIFNFTSLNEKPTSAQITSIMDTIRRHNNMEALEINVEFDSADDYKLVADTFCGMSSFKKIKIYLRENEHAISFLEYILAKDKVEQFVVSVIEPVSESAMARLCNALKSNRSVNSVTMTVMKNANLILGALAIRGGIKNFVVTMHPDSVPAAVPALANMLNFNEISSFTLNSPWTIQSSYKEVFKALQFKKNPLTLKIHAIIELQTIKSEILIPMKKGDFHLRQFSFSKKLDLEAIELIAEYLKRFNYLEALNLNYISEDTSIILKDALLVNKSLQRLTLMLSDPQLTITDLLKTNTTITKLYLVNGKGYTTEAIRKFGQILQENQTIRKLRIDVGGLDSLNEIFKALKSHTSLTLLRICYPLDYDIMNTEDLPEALNENWSLRYISKIGSADFEPLLERNKIAQKSNYENTMMAVHIISRQKLLIEKLPMEIWRIIFGSIRYAGVFINFAAKFDELARV
jgi:hypothetical protein